MTSAERADWETKEAIRAARFEAFVRRQLDARQAMERASREVCETRLAEARQQLEFSI